MVEKTIRKNTRHCRPTVFVYFRYIRKLLQNCMCGYYPPADNHAKISATQADLIIKCKIKTTRPTGGLLQGYKPMLPASASRRWLSLCSSLLPLPLSPPLKGCLYYSPPLKGSSYSRTLNLSSAISCFSWSSMYFLMVASFRPTVLT